jgi:hypothetical protein
MTDIFKDIVNFAGTALNQALTTDNLKDFSHASKLFVGDQYRLVPKSGFLFHVFIDINGTVYDDANPNGMRELGLMAKTAELPKFTVDTKTMNTYNRPTVVQSKIKYDPVSIVFHDDSSNLIRNFWINYYKRYYRDSDYSLTQYSLPFKYTDQQITDFGFSPRGDRFLKAIRIYSLHKKRFSEYILVNPTIKSLRHGQHDNQSIDSIMSHEMVIEYESVLYNSGKVRLGDPKGFADLHYDRSPSPLTPSGGGPRSVFGPGGIIDTGKDVLEDFQNGDYGSALFKAARGIKSAKSMNLKSAVKQELGDAINSAIRESVTQQRIIVPNLLSTGGITNTPFTGINLNSSLVALAGATLLRDSRVEDPINGARITDITQATSGMIPPNNYQRSFPPLAPIAIKSNEVKIINDQNSLLPNSNQNEVNTPKRKQDIDNRINFLSQSLTVVANEVSAANTQVITATTTFNSLNSRLSLANALPDSNPNKDTLISQIQQSMNVQQEIRSNSQSLYDRKNQEQIDLTREVQALRAERDTLV